MALTKTQVSELYTAIFNRASEGDGNAYWAGLNASAATIAQGMLDTTDAATYFGTSLATNQAFVEHIYLNTLNKTVAQDATGIAYWVDLLDAGHTRGEVVSGLVSAVADYATSTDATTLAAYNQFTNRVAVSDYTADTLATAPSDYATSTSFSSGLTVTDAIGTVTTAKTAVDVVKVDNTAVALALTTGVDTLTGSKASDTFTADILTVGATDSIIDASGTDNDTLNMTINNTVAATFKTTDVETINVTSLGGNTINMDLMTGVDALNTTGSTGTVTVAAAANAGMALGFAGSSTNNISATYTTDALSGTADKLMVNLSTATGVTAAVNAGFETAEVAVTGTSSLTLLTAPGVTAVTVSGTGALTIADNALAGFTGITITDTAAISTGAMTGVKTFVATANTGGIVDADIALTTTGFSDTNTIVGDTTGLSFLTGSGADNVSITDAATSNSSTIKLGAGNDKLKLLNTGTVATYIFGEAGDDTILIADSTTAIGANDLIDGGAGTDTLVVADADAQTWVLRGIENILLTNTAVTANTINSSDTALAVTAQVGSAAAHTAVNLATLTAGSTVTTAAATAAYGTAATTGQAGAVTVGFAATEATSTINLATGMTGALTLAKITNATVTLGAASTMTAAAITLTDTTTDLTINATGAFTTTTGNIVGNTLKNLTVTGTAGVTFDDMTSTALETVSVTAAGALNVGLATASLTALSNISYTATGTLGSITADNIGSATVTGLTVNATAAKAITIGNVSALGLTAMTVAGTSGAVTVGSIDSALSDIGTVSLTATNGLLAVETITSTDEIGTVTLTSTAGGIDLEATTAVLANDDTGITVNMSAATFINDTGLTGGGTSLVSNTAGDITSTLSGAAVAIVAYTSAGNAGSVNLNAVGLTGGLTTVITNDEIIGAGSSTITLGAALATTVNSVIFQGYAGAVSATGSIGMDTFTDVGTGLDGNNAVVVNSSDIFAGSTGTDTMSYADHVATAATITAATNEGTANGMAINLSSSTVTFYTGTDTTTTSTAVGISTLAAGKAAQYDSTSTAAVATAKAIVVGGEIDTVSGFESVVGTGLNDYIIGSSTGMTIDGGAGTDYITAGAGDDTINVTLTNEANNDVMNGGIGTDTLVLLAAAGVNTFATDASLTNIENITNNSTGTLTLTGQTDTFAITGGAAINTVVLGTGTTTYTGGLTATDVLSASAGVASTVITGDATTITFTGHSAIDTFTNTGNGAVSFTGAAGADVYTGGTGVDTLVFAASAALNGIDAITSFTNGAAADILDFSAHVTGSTLAQTLATTAATGNATITDETVVLVQINAAITAKDYGAADFAEVFAGAAKYINTTVGASDDDMVLVVEGTDITQIYYVDASATTLTSGMVVLVGTIDDTSGWVDANIA